MPSTKRWSSADLDAAIERVTPDVLALLGDGVPRTEAAIVAVLAGRHPKDDVRRTLMRLAVTEQLVEKGGKYILPAAEAERGGAGRPSASEATVRDVPRARPAHRTTIVMTQIRRRGGGRSILASGYCPARQSCW
jgi:hypothetical protein